jgi:urease accessory protein
MSLTTSNPVDLQSQINALEKQLLQAKSRLHAAQWGAPTPPPLTQQQPCHDKNSQQQVKDTSIPSTPAFNAATHFLLLLSDSALPLGSFAFSSGLESFLAHQHQPSTPLATLFSPHFLPLSLSSYASTTLPYVLAAHRQPPLLPDLDDALDAATICTVGRRASVAQGRALLGIWEKSFVAPTAELDGNGQVIRDFAQLLRSSRSDPPAVAAHLAPLFGAVCRAYGLDVGQTAFVFMLNHVKALVSAAVRRGMFGPYQAQKILAGDRTRGMIEAVVRREWDTDWEMAGQSVPVMDLWVGRHEMLYSRIFNS